MKLNFTLIALCFSLELMAQKAGTLDSSFGVNGKVISDVSEHYYNNGTTLKSVLIEKDGSIITAGNSEIGVTQDALFAKYYPNGSIDSSFGDFGILHYGHKSENVQDILSQARLQSNGKILALIQSFLPRSYLVRFLKNGNVDSSFGKQGKVELSYIGNSLDINDSDDIVVCEINRGHKNLKYALQRFSKDGNPDSTFGNNNLSLTVIGPDESFLPLPPQVKFDKTGKIVVGGTWYPNGKSKFIFLRFRSTGQPDNSFNDSGKLVLDTVKQSVALHSLIIQEDNKIVGGGNNEEDFLTTRILPDGKIDKTFGVNGFVRTDFSSTLSQERTDEIASLCLQSDGKIIAAGTTIHGFYGLFAICRYLPDGTLDTSYGQEGKVVTNFGDNHDTRINDAALQSDGKLITAGYHENDDGGGGRGDVALARYLQEKKQTLQSAKSFAPELRDHVLIYPNPAQSILHIQGLPSNTKLTVVDFNGRIVASRELQAVNGVYDLNVSSLHAGNYLLKIETNGEVVTKQFVKE